MQHEDCRYQRVHVDVLKPAKLKGANVNADIARRRRHSSGSLLGREAHKNNRTTGSRRQQLIENI